MDGFIVTWDVDSSDARMCGRVRRFVFGYRTACGGRTYPHEGLVHREGVRYLGQSVLFVTAPRFAELRAFLHAAGVEHHVARAAIGAPVSC